MADPDNVISLDKFRELLTELQRELKVKDSERSFSITGFGDDAAALRMIDAFGPLHMIELAHIGATHLRTKNVGTVTRIVSPTPDVLRAGAGLYGEATPTKVSPQEDRVRALEEEVNREAWNYYELRASIVPPFTVEVHEETGPRRHMNPTLRAYYEGAARHYASDYNYEIVERLTGESRDQYSIVLLERKNA